MAYRTHTCGELRKGHQGKTVKLAGWVDTVRTMGKFGFMDLRDRYGITQIFFKPELVTNLQNLRRECVVSVEGMVKVKPKANPKLATGEIEVEAISCELLSPAKQLPLELDESVDSTEETRLRYRVIDLRKPRMHKNIMLRHKITSAVHEFLDAEEFVNIETPLLGKSTPEGARDYLVPSRVQKGKFFALPQSPQLYKQMLMMAGFDKYYQIAKCLRDEDLRSDRQPEFTQIDMEMSFITEEDIQAVTERMMKHIFRAVLKEDIEIPFERISYDDAMKKYKTDKPDMRKEGEKWKFEWVVDFPMFEYSEEEDRYTAKHHPFTRPQSTDFSDMDKVKAHAYDLVLNGWEIGGGSLRIFSMEMQKQVFKAIGISEESAQNKFGFLLESMEYGCPPLGGIALGVDRIAALLAGETSLREVIAFPKNKNAEDLLTGAPSDVNEEQLDELGLSIKK